MRGSEQTNSSKVLVIRRDSEGAKWYRWNTLFPTLGLVFVTLVDIYMPYLPGLFFRNLQKKFDSNNRFSKCQS